MLNTLALAKLILKIQFPTLEECWDDGHELSSTHTLDENPYKVGTANYYHWQEGWWHGKLTADQNESIYDQQAANDENLVKEKIQI